jgi:dephospho-CoA kinase
VITERVQIVAITGGIGSGKSRVSSMLANLCDVPLIDLDDLCRKLLCPGAAGWKALQGTVDSHFFTPTGQLDRQAFRAALFADKTLRSTVDNLLHPLAQKALMDEVATLHGIVLVEIPLLFEAGWQDFVDKIIVVSAGEKERIQRIVRRDNVSVEQACQSISAQFSLQEKADMAHHVVDNSGGWQNTCSQLHELARNLGCRE